MCKQLEKYCFDHDLLPDQQFGFLKGRSAEWQLLSVLQDWHEALDQRKGVHAIFLDAAKAFDRVDHTVLLRLLSELGVGGLELRWFCSYLSDRKIQTRVDGVLSSSAKITSGVPQGSVLGPLLFLLYFRKIPEVSTAASALFADDTLVYRCDCCGSDECCCIRSDLSKISEWAVDNKVLFNAAKSADMYLGAATSPPPAALSGVDLPRVESKCHLGVVLSSDLRWDAHVSRSLKQTAGYVALLMNLAYRHRMPSGPLRRFYCALIRPQLEYCSAVWGGCSLRLQQRLDRVQIRVAKAICRRKDLSVYQLLQCVGLPTLAWRRRCHRVLLLWKLLNGCGPPQLQNHLPKKLSVRCTYSLRAPIVWNVQLATLPDFTPLSLLLLFQNGTLSPPPV